MKQYKTYLFDADGTLLDTTELIYQSFLNSCRLFGNYEIERTEVYKHIGIPLETQLELYLGKRSSHEFEKILKTHAAYQKQIYNQTLKAFNGVLPGLEELKKRDVQLGIVSSRTRESLDRYMKHVNIFDFFTVISTPERTENHKPHPEPVLWAMDQIKADPRDTIFVGDAVFDIESGNSAGVDTAFVTWGHNTEAQVAGNPTYIINSFDELLY
jgi:pyrophosphatase PpaX